MYFEENYWMATYYCLQDFVLLNEVKVYNEPIVVD